MSIKSFRPVTPSLRYISVSPSRELSRKKPEKRLVKTKRKTGGRNSYGRITSRGIGGGHKQKVRTVDFKRKRRDAQAEVIAIEYDPMRSARLALIQYKDGEKAYIVAPKGLEIGQKVMAGEKATAESGNALPLRKIPTGEMVHNIELQPGKGGQLVRSAGASAVLMSKSDGFVQLRLPSDEIRLVNENCYATVGQIGNIEHSNLQIGKAGRSRHMGRRPLTRAVAKNPIDHPMGGGEGRTSGGGHPVTPWGVVTKGKKTRKRRKYSDRFILVRRNGKAMK